MKEKKFVITLFFSVLVISILFILLNLTIYKLPYSTLWIYNSYIKKENYANSIKCKKIVFTSGSNTLFGIEAKIIENVLQIPTVNMAVHAGLGTDYILYRVKNILNNGDIVILPLEYENYLWNGEEDETRTSYILTYDRRYFFNELSICEKLSMLFSIKPFGLIKTLRESFITLKEPEIGRGYNSETLNLNGDETYKKGTKVLNSKFKPFELIQTQNTKGLTEIVKFANWCRENNIKLFVTFPNTINHSEYYREPYTTYFNNLISFLKNNGIAVIGKPTDSLYPIECFYDTNYHLNSYGAKKRTLDFLETISKNHLRDFGVLLTKDNIDSHIANLRKQITDYNLSTLK